MLALTTTKRESINPTVFIGKSSAPVFLPKNLTNNGPFATPCPESKNEIVHIAIPKVAG